MASQIEAAEHIFTSPQRFTQLRKDGHLPASRGRAGYVLDEVRRAYIAYLQSRTPDTAAAMDERSERRQQAVDDLATERARKEAQMADRLALENQRTRQLLIPASALRGYCEQVAALVRPVLEALPGQCKRRIPHLRASEIGVIKSECAKASDAVASIEVQHG